MKKQKRNYDSDEDDNDYPLGTGQIDLEGFNYSDTDSPQQQDKKQIEKQQQSMKKSDQTKPSTDKQNKHTNQKSQYNSNTSSIDVQLKSVNQLVSVESFNPKINEEKKKNSSHNAANAKANNSKESSNHNSYNKNAFKKQTNNKQQFEVQMVEQSYEEDDIQQVTGTFKKTPDTKNNNSTKQSKDTNNYEDSEQEEKKQKQLSKHKKMILEDSDDQDSNNSDSCGYNSKNKQQSKPITPVQIKNNQRQQSRSKGRAAAYLQKNKSFEEEDVKTQALQNQKKQPPKKKQSDISVNTNKSKQQNKPDRDDIRRKSSGPHQFKKIADNDNNSSNEKQKPQKLIKPQISNKQPKKRYGGYNDDSDEEVNKIDQDDVGMKTNTNQSSDEEKGKIVLKSNKRKISTNFLNESSEDEKPKKAPKSPNVNSTNKIDFYQQKKQPPLTNLKNATNNKKPQQQNKKVEDEEESEDDNLSSSSSVEIFDNYSSSNPISQDTNAKKLAAKGFTKQKALDSSYEPEQDNIEQDQDQVLDTNPENHLIEQKKKNRMSVKTEEFFNFEYDQNEEPQPNENFYMEEQGVAWAELNSLNEYFKNKKMKKVKKRRHVMKYIRARNLFFTSKWFMFFHFLQNVLFWMVVIVFPVISVIGCDGGHKWMSHVAMAFYLGLFLIFDCVFAFQYIASQSDRFDLKGYSRNKTNRSGKCCHMFVVWLYCIFEMLMTQVGLFDIYCDMAFATLVAKAGITDLTVVAFFSIGLIAIPKIYAFILQLLILLCQVREEDKKRKYAQRILLLNEYRMQAANIDYIEYEKSKTDLMYGLYKFAFEDIPQFIIKVIFLTQYDCGRKYTNGIVYCGLLMALFNTYFGLLYRFGRYCYSRKRVKSYERKVEVKVNNLDLSEYGFRHIRSNVHDNRKVQSIILSGQNYEYMILDERNIKKYEKFMTCFSRPERIEFLEINKLKFKSVRQEKSLLKSIDSAFKNLRYLTIQECGLCPNFILQFKIFMDGNDSLARLSMIMNRMPEDDCYELLENCLEHPNLEIIQLVERNWKQVKIKEEKDEKKQPMIEKPSAISVCRGIQFRLQQNEALKLLEIRYINLSRQILQAIFKGLQKNKKLQRLVMTNDTLNNATIADYKLLGDSLRVNQSLLCLDIQNNSELDNNPDFHSEIINGVINNQQFVLKRICITTESLEIKANYLELLDQRQDMTVFVGDKALEDVDIQE